jgi:hypothetical protein
VWSVEGQGSTFTLSLPRRASDTAGTSNGTVSSTAERPSYPPRPSQRPDQANQQEATP